MSGTTKRRIGHKPMANPLANSPVDTRLRSV